MIVVTISLLAGVGLGFLLKRRKSFLTAVETVTPWIICAMLFFLGVSLGMNEKVMANIAKLGINALLISVGGIAGSICLSIPLYRYISRQETKGKF
jgi:uncharacterized membrane protein YbjE (DUF340 family)